MTVTIIFESQIINSMKFKIHQKEKSKTITQRRKISLGKVE